MPADTMPAGLQVLPGAIKTLVEEHTTLRYKARSNGGEYAGPCPYPDCGGTDRFIVWPVEGRYYCRGCRRTGDALDFLCQHDGLTLLEACRQLDPEFDPARLSQVEARQQIRCGLSADGQPPSRAWQGRGEELVVAAAARLWSGQADTAGVLAYLREQRGLTDATIRRWRLGYWPRDSQDAAAAWGSPEQETPPGAGRGAATPPCTVSLPRGIVLPTFDPSGTLWAIKVRRPVPATAAGHKYHLVSGSRPALYGAQTLAGHTTAVLTEGEFDCILLAQEGGDLAGMVTLGGAAARLEAQQAASLLPLHRILVAYDLDSAGQQGAQTLASLSARVRVVRPLGGKDVSDMHRAGGDLRAWVGYLLAQHGPAPLTPAAVPVVDSSPPPSPQAQPPAEPPQARFLMSIRWGRQMGDLAVRDPYTGEWHEVPAAQCPDSWRQEARAAKIIEAAKRLRVATMGGAQ